MSQTERKSEIVRHILDYFLRNPNAADTAEGISKWRLASDRAQYTIEDTHEAIAWLLSQGLLEEVPSAYVSGVYRLSVHSAEEATKFLRQNTLPKPEHDT